MAFNTVKVEVNNQMADWAISDTLDVNINNEKVPVPPVHNIIITGVAGNQLFGGLTIIKGNPKKFVFNYEKAGIFEPTQSAHTEVQLFDKTASKVEGYLAEPDVAGIIIEIRQLMSPCVSCQKCMTQAVDYWTTSYRKPVIVRASAQIIDMKGGDMTSMLSEIQSGIRYRHPIPLQNSTVPSMENYSGIHRFVLP